MAAVERPPNEAWKTHPLGCVVGFLDPGEVYVFV